MRVNVLWLSENDVRSGVTMTLRRVDLLVVLALTTLTALRPASSASVSGSSSTAVVTDQKDAGHDDPSVNEVIKASRSSAAAADSDHDAAEIDNRIPIIFSELSDIDRALSSDGSVTGSGEVKLAGEHAHSTTTSGGTNVRVTPKYMLELYDKFSKDKYSYPMANIVRSFVNMNTGIVWASICVHM